MRLCDTERLIQEEAETLKSDVLETLRNHPLQTEVLQDKQGYVHDLLAKFDSFHEFKKWDEASEAELVTTKSLVHNIIESMQEDMKSGDDRGVMVFDLQVMKFLAYVNPNAHDHFIEHIFDSLEDVEVKKMWRRMIDAEAQFQAKPAEMTYPGRYSQFLEQVHFGQSYSRSSLSYQVKWVTVYEIPDGKAFDPD